MTAYLLVDNVRVPPDHVENAELRFRLHLPARQIRLISGAASPAEISGASDTRRLGVLLRRLRWVREDEAIEVPIDSPDFVDGFHQMEIHNPQAGPVRWTTGDAVLPVSLQPPWTGDVALHLTIGQWAGSTIEQPTGAEASVLGRFQTLGEDGEFGLVQRRYLSEPPLTLFSSGGSPLDTLIEGLEEGFARLLEPTATRLVWSNHGYLLQTRYATIQTHCTVEQDVGGQAEVVSNGRTTLRLLRRRLLKDLADQRQIFVFKSHDPAFGHTHMRRLHAALRQQGAAGLMCVQVAQAGQPIGKAERLADGLYAGYLERFVMATRGPYDQWLSLCAATLALHDQG